VPADLPLEVEEQADLGQLPSPPQASRSIANHLINNKEFCLLSLDINRGVVLWDCAVVGRNVPLKLKEPARGCKDSLDNWAHHTDTFKLGFSASLTTMARAK
jgi:hypothetical protein